DRIFVYRLLHARIDAGQNHRLIVPLSRERDVWNERKGRSTYGDSPYNVPAIEFAVEKTSATRAGSLTSNHLQCRHCPSLGGDLTISNFCGRYPFTLILHMRDQQKCATVTGDVSGSERGSINFAVRRSSTW